jgi:hypothetical protein
MLMLKILGISIETIATQVRDLHRKTFEEKAKAQAGVPDEGRHGEARASLQDLAAQVQTLVRTQQDHSHKLDRLLEHKYAGAAGPRAGPGVVGGGGDGGQEGGESEVEARLTAAAEVLCDVQDAIEAQDEKIDKVLSMMAAADERHAPLEPLVEALRASALQQQQLHAAPAAAAAAPATHAAGAGTHRNAARSADEEHGADGEATNLRAGSFPSSPHTPATPPDRPPPSERSGGADQGHSKRADGSSKNGEHKNGGGVARGEGEGSGGNRESGGGGQGGAGGRAVGGESRAAVRALEPRDGGSKRARGKRYAQRIDTGCDTVYVPGCVALFVSLSVCFG